MERSLIAGKYGTDKNQVYLDNYERVFSGIRNEKITMLELGIFKGESLLLWEEYFINGKIVGIDKNESDTTNMSNRIFTFQGDQQDKEFLDFVARETAPNGYDVIIDDASHVGDVTKTSFWHLFEKHLKPGGIYVVEDWRTGYWDAWLDGKKYKNRQEAEKIRPFVHELVSKCMAFAESRIEGGLVKRKLISILGRAKRKSYKRHYPSHDYGMVGFIKELIDELGVDMITSSERGSTVPQRQPRFKRMEIVPGQVFVIKNNSPDTNC